MRAGLLLAPERSRTAACTPAVAAGSPARVRRQALSAGAAPPVVGQEPEAFARLVAGALDFSEATLNRGIACMEDARVLVV